MYPSESMKVCTKCMYSQGLTEVSSSVWTIVKFIIMHAVVADIFHSDGVG